MLTHLLQDLAALYRHRAAVGAVERSAPPGGRTVAERPLPLPLPLPQALRLRLRLVWSLPLRRPLAWRLVWSTPHGRLRRLYGRVVARGLNALVRVRVRGERLGVGAGLGGRVRVRG